MLNRAVDLLEEALRLVDESNDFLAGIHIVNALNCLQDSLHQSEQAGSANELVGPGL